MKVNINGSGDLFFRGDLKHIIDKECEFIKQCKSGLIQVKYDGKYFSIPKRNVDVIEVKKD